MKFQVSDGEQYQKIMQVEIPAADMELPIKLACKRLAGKVNIPGFRQGKAPRSVLESFIGIDSILQEAADDIMSAAYPRGLKETGLRPCAQPKIEIVQLAKDEPMIFKAIITVMPEVTLGQYKGLEVTRRQVEVSEKDVDKDLEEQRQRLARMVEAPADYAAQLGDVVKIDFVGKKDGVPFEGGAGNDFPLELGSMSFIPGFEDQLVGCKTGDIKTIEVSFPEDYQEPTLAGQPATFDVTVHEITNKVLPELDQAFVEEVSETAENMDQLREQIKARLTAKNADVAEQTARREAITIAMKNANVDIPPVMVEQQLNHLLEDTEQRMMMQGIKLEQYLEYTGGTMEQMRDNYRARAELVVRNELVLDAIITAEDIQVNDDELHAELEKLAEGYHQPVDKLRELLEQNDRLDDFIYEYKLQKADKFVYDNAIVTEKIVTAEQLAEEEATRKAVVEQALKAAAEEAEKMEAANVEEAAADEADKKDAE